MKVNSFSSGSLVSGSNAGSNGAYSSPLAGNRHSAFHKQCSAIDCDHSSRSAKHNKYRAETCGIPFPAPNLFNRSCRDRERQHTSHGEAAPERQHYKSRGCRHCSSGRDIQKNHRRNTVDAGKSKVRSTDFLSRPTPVSKTCRLPSTATRKHSCKVETQDTRKRERENTRKREQEPANRMDTVKKRKDGGWACFGAY